MTISNDVQSKLDQILDPMNIDRENVSVEDLAYLQEIKAVFHRVGLQHIAFLISKFIAIQLVNKNGGIPVAKEILLHVRKGMVK